MSSNGEEIVRFHTLLRAKDIDAAAAYLDQLCKDNDLEHPTIVALTARLDFARGRFSEGIEVLSRCINDGGDIRGGCRIARADAYLGHKAFKQAAADFLSLLDDPTPHVVKYFHATAAYHLAWLYAGDGNPAYARYLARVPDKKESYIIDRIVTPADIKALYEQAARPA